MKKLIKSAIVVMALMSAVLTFQAHAQDVAPGTSPVPTPTESLGVVGGDSGLPDFNTGQHSDSPPDFATPGVGAITSPLLFAIDLFRLAMNTIAFLVVIFAAIQLISTEQEDEASKAKSTLLVGIIGLLIIQLADVAVRRMFFGEQGEAFEDLTSAQLFADETVAQIRGIIGFIQVFVGITAVLVFVVRGFTLIASAGDEEQMNKAKRHVLYATFGLIIVALSEVVVRGVVFPDAGERLPDVDRARYILVNLTNFASGFVSIFAFAALFYAGYLYVISAGREDVNEKVKKIFLGAVIAILLSLGAFAAVNTFVEFTPRVVDETDDLDLNN